MRRQFRLPETDEEYLEIRGLPWETVLENNVMRVVLYDFTVPQGYNQEKVSVNLRIESSYPDSQIDMAYFHPPLARLDCRPINAIANDQFDSKMWQRWSRHRTSNNPWRPGIDCIETHLHLVEEWLDREFVRNP